MPTKPRSIDEYLAVLSAPQRAALEKLRKTIRAVAPQAEECISYGLAAFRLEGKPLVALGASPIHCAFYLMSSSTVRDHQEELQKYDTSTGTIRFLADKPLPATLVRKLVKARIAENALLAAKPKGAARKASPKRGRRSN
ncbi:MAG: iron chaperone [Planctomycetales bacterium]